MKTALTIAALTLALGGLAGCGSSDSAGSDAAAGDSPSAMPTDAATEDFCANFQNLSDDLAKLDPSSDASAAVGALQDAADNMASTGVPSDIPSDASNGFAVTLKAIQSLPADASAADISGLESSLSESEQADAQAFDTYLTKECGQIQ